MVFFSYYPPQTIIQTSRYILKLLSTVYYCFLCKLIKFSYFTFHVLDFTCKGMCKAHLILTTLTECCFVLVEGGYHNLAFVVLKTIQVLENIQELGTRVKQIHYNEFGSDPKTKEQ